MQVLKAEGNFLCLIPLWISCCQLVVLDQHFWEAQLQRGSDSAGRFQQMGSLFKEQPVYLNFFNRKLCRRDEMFSYFWIVCCIGIVTLFPFLIGHYDKWYLSQWVEVSKTTFRNTSAKWLQISITESKHAESWSDTTCSENSAFPSFVCVSA